MKDLRPYIEPDGILPVVGKVEENNTIRFLFLKEAFFNFRKAFKKNIIYYLLVFLFILLMKYPEPIGHATGKWLKEFVNAFTEQVYQIKKRPSM